jgi:ABC-2 type transport system permease protein
VRRSRLRRYLRIAAVQLRVNAGRAMAYRADFLLEGAMALAWMAVVLVPLLVLFDQRPTVAGWDEPSALIVVAYFAAIRAVLEGVVSPSLVELVERIRSGAFDYVLLKPADAQFLISAARQEPWKIVDVLWAVGLGAYALSLRATTPSIADFALATVMFGAGVAAMYALWIVCAAASFWVVRLDNLIHLLEAIFDTARWPIQVFRGAWRIIFTFIIPLGIMTTYPAMALLGRLDGRTALGATGGAIALLVISRYVWRMAIRSYTSASS